MTPTLNGRTQMVRIPLLAAAFASTFLPFGALAQSQGAAGDDCAFLEQSFQEVYDGLREHRRGGQQSSNQGAQGGGMAQAASQNPQLVTMFVQIQQNIILMHQARGCDAAKLVALARQEAQKYMNR